MYRLIASDIDGTLVNDDAQIPSEVKEAVSRAEQLGVRFALCSGRSFLSMAHFEKQLRLDAPGHYGIGFNGGMVYETDSHKILMEHWLKRALAMEIIDALRPFDVDILVYRRETLFAEKETPHTIAYRGGSRIPLTLIENFKSIQTDVSKVILRGAHEALVRVERTLQPMMKDRCIVIFSAENLLEFCPTEAHKGAGLAFLCRHLNIKPEETIAIGDHRNDVTMLRYAGLGIAVANAVPEAKAAAAVVADESNNENAVAAVIRKYLPG
jgi:Cof subfamily protein (haloacid dehalogenase superfamily)